MKEHPTIHTKKELMARWMDASNRCQLVRHAVMEMSAAHGAPVMIGENEISDLNK
jgi:hypothetical protein